MDAGMFILILSGMVLVFLIINKIMNYIIWVKKQKFAYCSYEVEKEEKDILDDVLNPNCEKEDFIDITDKDLEGE